MIAKQENAVLYVGSKELETYIKTFVFLQKRKGADIITIAARGKNTSTAIDLALWLKMNNSVQISDVIIRSIDREAREDSSKTVAMSEINIITKNGHG